MKGPLGTPGAGLRVLRATKGWTRKRLAGEMGVSPTYVTLLEDGDRTLTKRLVERVARVLSIDADVIRMLEDPRKWRGTPEGLELVGRWLLWTWRQS